MKRSEGIILQGCGGELQEWVDGINDALKKEGILLNDTKFSKIDVFKHFFYGCAFVMLLVIQFFCIHYKFINTL